MTDISHSLVANEFSDGASIVFRGQYFLLKKLLAVLAGSPSAAEKAIAKESLSLATVTTYSSDPFLYMNANANIESAAAGGTVSSITDEDYAAAADVIWAAYLAANS